MMESSNANNSSSNISKLTTTVNTVNDEMDANQKQKRRRFLREGQRLLLLLREKISLFIHGEIATSTTPTMMETTIAVTAEKKTKIRRKYNDIHVYLFLWLLLFIFIFFSGVLVAYVFTKSAIYHSHSRHHYNDDNNDQRNSAAGIHHRRDNAGNADFFNVRDDHHQERMQQHHHHHSRRRSDSSSASRGNDETYYDTPGSPTQRDGKTSYSTEQLEEMLDELDFDMKNNDPTGIQWVNPDVLIPLEGDYKQTIKQKTDHRRRDRKLRQNNKEQPSVFFRALRKRQQKMKWEEDYEQLLQQQQNADAATTSKDHNNNHDVFKSKVDYTTYSYAYPPILSEPPRNGGYPHLKPLQQIMEEWPQDEDVPHDTIRETLIHFNFSDPVELEMARTFRDAELPFKLTDVPEVYQASLKWTDDYVSANFQSQLEKNHYFNNIEFSSIFSNDKNGKTTRSLQNGPKAKGNAQESTNHFFAFYINEHWDLKTMGLPPVRNNDWSFEKWAKHARYADAVSLKEDQPHYYWQSGIPREERLDPNKDTWSFISRDLPSFSSNTENFIMFHPDEQKGIQCRFGERGVTSAIHYDSGRNMIGMVTGAKRYILMPPNQCSRLGIATDRMNPVYRHSLLDYGHLNHYKNDISKNDIQQQQHWQAGANTNDKKRISQLEYDWLEKASKAQTVETVLKSGEVLYLPSFWFHYIVSLQKSAQCNARSGIDEIGNPEFGNIKDVKVCQDR